MAIYLCDTHRVTIEVTENRRKIQVQLNNRGVNQCVLNRTKEIREGTFNDCVIRKIKE